MVIYMTSTRTPNATTSIRREGENVVITFHENGETRVSAETARYDATVEIPAGEYTLRPITIGGQPSTFDDAYYFTGSGEGVLVSGGYDDETPGKTMRRFGLMPYGYQVRSRFNP